MLKVKLVTIIPRLVESQSIDLTTRRLVYILTTQLLFWELELITITLDLDVFKVSLFAIMYFSIAFISVLILTLRSAKFVGYVEG